VIGVARFEHLEFGSDKDASPAKAAARGERPAPPADDERQSLRRADEFRRKGQYENALRQYSRALEFDKSLVAAWVGQVQMLVMLNEAPEAEIWARKALEIFPGNGELLAGRAQALARMGDIKRAGEASDAALAVPGKSAYRWLARGEWMLAGRQKLEEHCFNKAAQLDSDWLILLESALIYMHYNFASRAVVRARSAAEAAPDQYHIWFVRGCAEDAAGMKRPSAESLEQCLRLCPGHADALQRLGGLNGGFSPLTWLRRVIFRG
jgi:tetratricopeptide (TPR) repeat protein